VHSYQFESANWRDNRQRRDGRFAKMVQKLSPRPSLCAHAIIKSATSKLFHTDHKLFCLRLAFLLFPSNPSIPGSPPPSHLQILNLVKRLWILPFECLSGIPQFPVTGRVDTLFPLRLSFESNTHNLT